MLRRLDHISSFENQMTWIYKNLLINFGRLYTSEDWIFEANSIIKHLIPDYYIKYRIHWKPPSRLNGYKKRLTSRRVALFQSFIYLFVCVAHLVLVSLKPVYGGALDHMHEIKQEFILFIRLRLCNCIVAHAWWPESHCGRRSSGIPAFISSDVWEYKAMFQTFVFLSGSHSFCSCMHCTYLYFIHLSIYLTIYLFNYLFIVSLFVY